VSCKGVAQLHVYCLKNFIERTYATSYHLLIVIGTSIVLPRLDSLVVLAHFFMKSLFRIQEYI
jgi:hypothetical protein